MQDILKILDVLDELREKATQGEWNISEPWSDAYPSLVDIAPGVASGTEWPACEIEDANYIVALHNNYPVFSDTLRRALKVVEKMNLTIDHIIPVSKGGTNDKRNLVTCCHECNKTKADNVLWVRP
jgi:hypothetical protein